MNFPESENMVIFELHSVRVDGNASDKPLNQILTTISKQMAEYGIEEGAFIYIADQLFRIDRPTCKF